MRLKHRFNKTKTKNKTKKKVINSQKMHVKHKKKYIYLETLTVLRDHLHVRCVTDDNLI